MKEKIYLVSWNGVSYAGGVERVTQYMYDAWKDLFDVVIVDYDFLRNKSCMGSLLNKHHIIDGFISSCVLRKIKRNEPDAKVVIQGFNCPFVKADLSVAHGTMRGYQMALNNNNRRWHINQIYEKLGFKNSKRILAVGSHVKSEIVDLYGVPNEKIFIVENCIDTDVFYPVDRTDDGICHLIFSGRIEYGKGMHFLHELARLIEDIDGFDLTIATTNSCNAEMFSELAHTRVLIGLNQVQLNDFYNHGSVMVFPSLYEGFGLAVPECLAAGVPVLGYDIGATSDLYNSGVIGVDILSKNIYECLNQARRAAAILSDMNSRLKMHMEVEKRFGFSTYRNRLINIWNE